MQFKFYLFVFLLINLLINPKFEMGVNLSCSDILVVLIFFITAKLVLSYKHANVDSRLPICTVDSMSHGRIRNGLFDFRISFMKSLNPNVRRVIRKFRLIYFILFVWFLIIIVYSDLLGNNYHQILGRFRNLFFYPLVFFSGILLCQRRGDALRYINFLNYYVILAVVFGAINIAIQIPFFYQSLPYQMILRRQAGVIAILSFVYACLNLLFREKQKESIIIIAVCFTSVVGSQNRSVIVSYLLALTLIGFTSIVGKVKINRLITVMAFSIVAVLIMFFAINSSTHWGKFATRYERMVSEVRGESPGLSQFSRRVGRTIGALRHWLDGNPLIGSGWGSHASVFHIYDFSSNYRGTAYNSSHNYYASILDQTGIIGLFIMFSVYYNIYKVIKPKQKLSKESILEYSFYIFFLCCVIFNSANVDMEGLASYILGVYFIFGLAVANSSTRNSSTETKRI